MPEEAINTIVQNPQRLWPAGGPVTEAEPAHRFPPVRSIVVPAAGLGSRLLPATLGVPKELLPLGRWPVLVHTLLEAVGAGIEELVVVASPGKPGLRRFLDPTTWGELREQAALAPLQALLKMVHVRLVEQPEPFGVLDAVERGRLALPGGPCAVLYPDLIHLPDQSGLKALIGAWGECGETVFGLHDASQGRPGTHGPASRVELTYDDEHDTLLDRPFAPYLLRKIASLDVADGTPRTKELRTTFGMIQGSAYNEVTSMSARSGPGAPLDDSRHHDALNELARAGKLYGVILPGEILDLGNPAGWLDASRRFSEGKAAWRDLTP